MTLIHELDLDGVVLFRKQTLHEIREHLQILLLLQYEDPGLKATVPSRLRAINALLLTG